MRDELHETLSSIVQDQELRNVVVLFVWAFLESIIWPVPIAFILAGMVLINPSSWLVYSVTVTLGSVSGAIIAYHLGGKFRDIILTSPRLEWFRNLINLKYEKFKEVQDMYNKYGAYAIIIAAVSPIPYKLVTWASGIMGYNLNLFILLSVIGRGLVFLSMGYMFSVFGETAYEYLGQSKDLQVIVILVIIIAILIYLIYKHFTKNRKN
ncbi:MAG: VTT domain-containing protein [Candidatus Micrarchaeota archaeon]|nr:VTT domain-containing protein [Candidatus Micrarchaeota archaeon]MCX8154425.1 VTT domain-containing protein [Candidatus Micrarchaeota archaeon]